MTATDVRSPTRPCAPVDFGSTAAELDPRSLLRGFRGLVDPAVGVIASLRRDAATSCDEPVFPAFRAELRPTRGALSDGGYAQGPNVGGRDLRPDKAMVAAIFEAIERYCLSIYRDRWFVRASYSALARLGREALDPRSLGSEIGPDAIEAELAWFEGWSVNRGRPLLVPAQLVFVPYVFKDEPELRDPITTGAASGLSTSGAVMRGLLEVMERDATMLVHYARLGLPLVAPTGERLRSVISKVQAFGLDVALYDATLDHTVPIRIARVLDHSGIGMPMTIGSNAALDSEDAAIGAVLEAVCFRHPMRRRIKVAQERGRNLGAAEVKSAEDRAYFWSLPERLAQLDYFDGPPWTGQARSTHAPTLDHVIDAVADMGGEVVVCDVTTSDISDLGATVVKVLVPEWQPMHLCEPSACVTKRLIAMARSAELNPLPHPFL